MANIRDVPIGGRVCKTPRKLVMQLGIQPVIHLFCWVLLVKVNVLFSNLIANKLL